MHSFAKKTIAIASAAGVAGVSSIMFAAAPASATPTCENGGTLINATTCELTLTSGQTFTVQSDMSQLEALLVGGGGTGEYGGGGGGGQVKIVDFDGTTAPSLTVSVGSAGNATTISDGTTTATAKAGTSATNGSKDNGYAPGTSGVSGSGHKGYPEKHIGGGGGGAAGSPSSRYNGGAGLVASKASITNLAGKKVTPLIPLFKGDTNCYGGGGAVGTTKKAGKPGCNAGSLSEPGGTIVNPVDNMGGGGSSVISSPEQSGEYTGAAGVVVLRWNAAPVVTLTFNDGARGHNPKTEHLISGATPTKPTNPKVSHYKFLGWYTDPTFATPASFTVPITDSEIFYGKFAKK